MHVVLLHNTVAIRIVGASLCEPHINGSSMFAIYICMEVRPSRPSHPSSEIYYAQGGSMDISAKYSTTHSHAWAIQAVTTHSQAWAIRAVYKPF